MRIFGRCWVLFNTPISEFLTEFANRHICPFVVGLCSRARKRMDVVTRLRNLNIKSEIARSQHRVLLIGNEKS